MSIAHWHLVLVHLPILGVPLGLLLLSLGLLRRNEDLRRLACVGFMICAMAAWLAQQTGEGAEEQIEHRPAFSESAVHQHEEMAEKSTTITIILALVATGVLIQSLRGKTLPPAVTPLILTLAVVSSGMLFYTGALGGQVGHPEIRGDSLSPVFPAARAGHDDD